MASVILALHARAQLLKFNALCFYSCPLLAYVYTSNVNKRP